LILILRIETKNSQYLQHKISLADVR